MESFGEALEFLLRIVRRHEGIDDIDQTLRTCTCARRLPTVYAGRLFLSWCCWSGCEETVINQEAQDHAAACAFFTGLLGQLAPSAHTTSVLNKNLHEPPQRVALDNIKHPPAQVGGDQIAISLFLCIFDRHDEPLGLVGTDV